MEELNAFLPGGLEPQQPDRHHRRRRARSGTRRPSRSPPGDEESDGLLVILTPQAMTDPTATARELVPLREDRGQARPRQLDGRRRTSPRARRSCARPASPPSPTRTRRAVFNFTVAARPQPAAALRDADAARRTRSTRSTGRRPRRSSRAARAEGRTLLTEYESKELLAAYGIPITETVRRPDGRRGGRRRRPDRLPGRRQALLPHDHPQDRRRRRPAQPQGRGRRPRGLRADPGRR